MLKQIENVVERWKIKPLSTLKGGWTAGADEKKGCLNLALVAIPPHTMGQSQLWNNFLTRPNSYTYTANVNSQTTDKLLFSHAIITDENM